jgi:ubiquinone biosynthesis protein
MGFISIKDQKYMGENILSFIKRDYRRVAELHILSGWIPSFISIDHLEQAICSVWEPIFNKELKDISFEKTFKSLMNISKMFNMKIQPQLLLFQKTLFSIEGLSRFLYPKINFWKITRPILEKWVINQFDSKIFLKSIRSFSFFWLANFLDVNKNVKIFPSINNLKEEKIIIFKNLYIIFIIIFLIVIVFLF